MTARKNDNGDTVESDGEAAKEHLGPEAPDGGPAAPCGPSAEQPSAEAAEAAEEAAPKEAEAPAEKSAEEQIEEIKDQLLRALAEVENTRRRARLDVENANKYAIGNLARDLLAVADNLRRGLDAIPANAVETDELLKNLADGVEMVERELLGAFEKHGIRKIEPLGEKFDHNFHQAMFEVPDAEHPPGTVVQLVAPGYVIRDRLLRPAMVGVASGGPKGDDEAADTTDGEEGAKPKGVDETV